MPLSDKWTRAQLRTLIRNEINDPIGTAAWSWPDAELNAYIDEWQQRLQEHFEFVWAVATTTIAAFGTTTNSLGNSIPNGTASIAINTFIPNALRADAFYWTTSPFNPTRLIPRTEQDLDVLMREWRNVLPNTPTVIYQKDITQVILWPAPSTAGTLIAEFPAKICFSTDTSPMQIPAWTRYSVKNYCAMRALMRTGPNQDLQRALTYKALWLRQLKRFRRLYDSYLPKRYPQLKPSQPSDHYAIAIRQPTIRLIVPP